MTTQLTYSVEGYRSLRKTTFTLNSGLNAFVGPNGSGKTNIASLIDFLSAFVADGMHAAFARAGGSSRVFSNELLADTNKDAELKIKVRGDTLYEYSPPGEMWNSRSNKIDKKTINFSYEVCLRINHREF